MIYTICIPKPTHALSPNARCHWAKLYSAKRKARAAARILARAEWGPDAPAWKKAKVTHHWIMPTRAHHPDPDNAQATLKPWFDGFADWGIVENDKNLIPFWGGVRVTKLFEHNGQAWPRGCVMLTFEEVTE